MSGGLLWMCVIRRPILLQIDRLTIRQQLIVDDTKMYSRYIPSAISEKQTQQFWKTKEYSMMAFWANRFTVLYEFLCAFV